MTLTQYILKTIAIEKNIANTDAADNPNENDKSGATSYYMKITAHMIFTKFEFQNFFSELIFYIIILRLKEI